MKTRVVPVMLIFSILMLSKLGFATHEGCTPGFWKNNVDLWVKFSPSQTIQSAFDADSVWWWSELPPEVAALGNDTLFEALSYHGGQGLVGAARILLRQLVAGLLNAAAYPSVSYWTLGNFMKHAYSMLTANVSREMYLIHEGTVNYWNELGCPLSSTGAKITIRR